LVDVGGKKKVEIRAKIYRNKKFGNLELYLKEYFIACTNNKINIEL